MYHASSKRRQILMRTFVYALMTLSVISIVAVLMLVILGYSFNRQDGKLEQGGLLQFASTPSGAAVTMDDVQLGSRTPSKANVEAKSHHVQMDLKGYRSWQKTITIQAGGVGWLSYARLVPTDIQTERVRTFPKLAASLPTNDRKWIIAQEDAASGAFMLINLESDTPKLTSLKIPDTVVTAAETTEPQTYTLVAWSKDDDKILVKRTYDSTKTEWLVVDRQTPAKTVNVTAAFAITATDIQFGNRDGSNAYVLTDDGIVRRIDFGGATLSGPLAENVAEFSVYDEKTLLYVTKPDAKDANQRHVGYRTDDMDAPQTIESYPEATTGLHVAFGEYYGKKYLAVTHDTTLAVYSGQLPRANDKGALRLLQQLSLQAVSDRLTIGDSGRFVVAETTNSFTTYDIELAKTDTTTFQKLAATARPLTWLDSYLIANDRGGVLRLYEFDGANQQDIMPVVEGQAMSLSGNDKYLYGFSAVDGGVALTRAKMIIAS